MKHVISFLIVSLLFSGCYKPEPVKYVSVVIVDVQRFESAWRQDYTVYKVIETGYRFQRCGVLGSVGDTMKLKETQLNWNDGY